VTVFGVNVKPMTVLGVNVKTVTALGANFKTVTVLGVNVKTVYVIHEWAPLLNTGFLEYFNNGAHSWMTESVV
jgi:hypothetical protein